MGRNMYFGYFNMYGADAISAMAKIKPALYSTKDQPLLLPGLMPKTNTI